MKISNFEKKINTMPYEYNIIIICDLRKIKIFIFGIFAFCTLFMMKKSIINLFLNTNKKKNLSFKLYAISENFDIDIHIS